MPDLWMDVDAALSEVPVNLLPLTDDTDFKSREVAIAYNAAGMDLVWNFTTTAGAFTQTAVTPTSGGDYDWTHQGDGMYTIEIPASGGASINNDTEGFGWFTGLVTGVLPWRGPVIGFRAAALNNALIDGGDVLDVNATEWLGTAIATPDTNGYPKVTVKDGTGAGEIALTSGAVDTVTNVANNVTVDLDDIANAVWQSIMSPIWGLGDVVSSTSSTLVIDVLEGDFPDDFFNGLLVIVTDTSDIKQIRLVTDYVASTQTLTISPDWVTNPDNTYVFSFYAFVASSGGGLDAAGVRAAVGLASANLDTQLAGLDSLIDTVDSNVDSILADTNELQTDWANGGRLDLILDARASQASVDTIDDFLDTEVAAILADTNELQTDWADGGRLDLILDARASQSSVNTIDDFLDTEIAAILEDTGTTLPAQISGLNNLSAAQVNAEVVDVLRTDTIPDSYAADGAQPTITQALLAILQFLTEKEVSGTTVTVNKPDGTTAAFTLTLDDGTTPTSITRAT